MPFAARPLFRWQLRTRSLPLGERTLLMAILNVTPDSFSDGGEFFTVEHAAERACTLLDQGADILDIGGESTRPNAEPVTAEVEQQRILPAIEAILHTRPDAILSVDTYHAATAKAALERGVEIVNDVSGLLWDNAMAAVVADARCGLVLMHTRGTPQEWPHQTPLAPEAVMPLVLADLAKRLHEAETARIPATSIVIDPGFGFGKLGGDNFILHAQLERLHHLGFPMLSGTSRKGFLVQALALRSPHAQGVSPESRLAATTASHTAAILAGAHILRVHEVSAALAAATVADAILKNS